MLAFVFPGQGSHRIRMGERLFDDVLEFSSIEADIDHILGYSLRALCLYDSDSRLSETSFTQPSLYVVNAMHYYEAISKNRLPQFVAGHSLGEYNALLAAGVFDFLTGLKLVKKRGELMGQVKNGGMAAILGLPNARVRKLLIDNGLAGVDIANYNSPLQTVISGPVGEIMRSEAIFESAGATLFVRLPVSGAFHSRYMVEAANAFGEYLASFSFGPPQIPVIANLTGEPYIDGSIKELLTQQITHPVQWTKTVFFLKRKGVTDISEIGPGNVLTRLNQQIHTENKI